MFWDEAKKTQRSQSPKRRYILYTTSMSIEKSGIKTTPPKNDSHENKVQRFIKTSPDLSTAEKILIHQELKDKDTREIFRLIITMTTWFSTVAVSDAIIKSISGSAALAQKAFTWSHVLPSLLFNAGNSALKYVYLRKKFSHLLNRRQSFLSSVPMIGLPLMIGMLFKETPTFAKALKLYVKQQNPLRRFTQSVSQGVKKIIAPSKKVPEANFSVASVF